MIMRQHILSIIAAVVMTTVMPAMAQSENGSFSIMTLNVDGLPGKFLVFNVNEDGLSRQAARPSASTWQPKTVTS